MKKLCLIIVLLFWFFPGIVFGYSVSLYGFTGDDAEVLIEITGDGTTSITFEIQVINPAYADLRGLWFNFKQFPNNSEALTVSGADVTGYSFIDDGVVDLGGGANINPRGPFDAGIEIGFQGIGNGDDFYSTSFIISYSDNLYLGDFFGARLMSVGDDREGSSKLVGTITPIPEPTTMLLFGTGLIGLAGASRKKIKK